MTDKEITRMWNEYYPKVFGYFYRRVSHRQDIEDLTSVSLASFLKRISDSDFQIDNQHAYLWRICYNQLSTYIHHKTKSPTPVPYDEEWVPEDTTIESQRSKEFTSRMDSLKSCMSKNIAPEDLSIISLSYFEDYSSDQIAQKLSLQAATVRKRLSRAIAKIRTVCRDLWLNYS